VDWIALARDGYDWQAVVKTVECCCKISGVLLRTQRSAVVKSVVDCCELSDQVF